MRTTVTVVLIFFALANMFPAAAGAAAAVPSVNYPTNYPTVSADAAILMDLNTGQVLYAKNPFKKRPPASTTKVMTTLLALELADLNEKVTVSREAAGTEGTSMYLSAGDIVPMADLIYGALLNSGNDASEAIAEHIAGSIDKFAVLMNIKALALGTVNTHFANPHGLPDENHYSCAYDLAVIAREAMANRTFAGIVSTKTETIDRPGEKNDRRLKNTNKLLWRYIWTEGVKTGTTSEAGQCLIAAAAKDSRKLLAVVLRSGDRWSDTIRLFEYGFNNYEYRQVAVKGAEFGNYRVLDGKSETVRLVYAADHGIMIPSGKEGALEKRVSIEPYPQAPIEKGQVLGSISYFADDSFAGRVDLIAGEDIERAGFWDKLGRMLKTYFSRFWRNFF